MPLWPVNITQALNKAYLVDSKPTKQRRAELAKELGLFPSQVNNWFEKRRAKGPIKMRGFSEAQRESLKKAFEKYGPKPSKATYLEVGEPLGLTYKQVRDWFCSNRGSRKSKVRKKVSNNCSKSTSEPLINDTPSPRDTRSSRQTASQNNLKSLSESDIRQLAFEHVSKSILEQQQQPEPIVIATQAPKIPTISSRVFPIDDFFTRLNESLAGFVQNVTAENQKMLSAVQARLEESSRLSEIDRRQQVQQKQLDEIARTMGEVRDELRRINSCTQCVECSTKPAFNT